MSFKTSFVKTAIFLYIVYKMAAIGQNYKDAYMKINQN